MSPSEAAEIARLEEFVAQTGALVIAVALVLLGPVLGFVMRRKEEGEKFRLLPFLICSGVGLFGLIGQISRLPGDAASSQSRQVAAASDAEIEDTMTPVPPDAKLLATTASRAAELETALRRQSEALLARSGHPSMRVSARVFDVLANGMIVTRATASTSHGIIWEQAEGIVHGQHIKIICNPIDPRTFVFEGSPCEQRMEEIFGSFRVPTHSRSS